MTALSNAGWNIGPSTGNPNAYGSTNDYLDFHNSGDGTGYIEKALPSGGNYAVVRWGNQYSRNYAEVLIGGVVRDTTSGFTDKTVSVSYTSGQAIRIQEVLTSIVGVWSIDICHSP